MHTCHRLPVTAYPVLTLPLFSHFRTQEEFNGKPDSLFFTDGQRRIDFVLVYEDESKKENNKKGTNEKQKVGLAFSLVSLLSPLISRSELVLSSRVMNIPPMFSRPVVLQGTSAGDFVDLKQLTQDLPQSVSYERENLPLRDYTLYVHYRFA